MAPDFFKTSQTTYPTQVTHFDELIANNQLSHLYLFVGPSQPKKLAFSRYLAWQIVGDSDLNAIRIEKNEHPDVKITQPSLPKSGHGTRRVWKVEQIRNLTPDFVTTTQESQRKVFVFDAVETLSGASGNALLKFIEEPAGPQLIVMLAENVNDVLKTIQSRAQIVHLLPEIPIDDSDDTVDNDWRKKTQLLLFKWFELMMQRRIESFAYVQLQLIDQLKEEKQQELFLEWLHQLSRDTVVFGQVPDEQLMFPKLVGLYKTLVQHYTNQQLVQASDAIFSDDHLRKINVSLQTRLEKIVLDTTLALGE